MERLKPTVIAATIAHYPVIQNLARFYVYDRSGYMGWGCDETGMFECIDFKHYFESPDKKSYLIKVDEELAGFVLLDKVQLLDPIDWNMGEFFVIAKFQGKGIAQQVMADIFSLHPGKWSIAVMPENIKAVHFWKKVIMGVVGTEFTEVFKTAEALKTMDNSDTHDMDIFSFDTLLATG